MFCANRFGIADCSQIEFAIPFQQFFFVTEEQRRLSPRNVNVEQCRCIPNEFFHDKNDYKLKDLTGWRNLSGLTIHFLLFTSLQLLLFLPQ